MAKKDVIIDCDDLRVCCEALEIAIIEKRNWSEDIPFVKVKERIHKELGKHKVNIGELKNA